MNIFVYSDESGVLDKAHNDFFVFAGVLFLSKEERDIAARKYIHAEKVVRATESVDENTEVKAFGLSPEAKNKLYRSQNRFEKFGIIVRQKRLLNSICSSKKSKQRYLDWAFKMALKSKLEALISEGKINPDEVEGLYVFVDEHNTATDGIYELRESLAQEFKFGTHNWNYMRHYPPILPRLKCVSVDYCNSAKTTLIRAADIVANKLLFMAHNNKEEELKGNKFNIIHHP